MNDRIKGPHIDYLLMAVAITLVAIGLVMVYSASSPMAIRKFGDPTYFALRNLVFAGGGLLTMLWVSRLPVSTIRSIGQFGFWVSLLLLMLVLIPGIGIEGGGARRWINLGAFTMQPSELFKVTLALFVAHLLTANPERVHKLRGGLAPILGVFGVAAALLMSEPDFGATVTAGAVLLGMIFISGVRVAWIISLLAVAVPAAAIGVIMAPYRFKRVISFLDPWDDPLGSDFQLVQSLLAFGNGGLTGMGLGEGRQKQFYLPESHTDFIFAVIGEELGLFMVLFMILLFSILVWRGFSIARRSQDRFVSLAATGISMLIGVQTMANMGVVMGLLPPKGLTLPLVSYGGSSLIVSMGAVGLLLAFSRAASDPSISSEPTGKGGFRLSALFGRA
ncbi:putative lipid II flippase FtsW [Magnetofaba australis]|nr:putative lipid II flippase FtsW [Magnetofaba australis]